MGKGRGKRGKGGQRLEESRGRERRTKSREGERGEKVGEETKQRRNSCCYFSRWPRTSSGIRLTHAAAARAALAPRT